MLLLFYFKYPDPVIIAISLFPFYHCESPSILCQCCKAKWEEHGIQHSNLTNQGTLKIISSRGRVIMNSRPSSLARVRHRHHPDPTGSCPYSILPLSTVPRIRRDIIKQWSSVFVPNYRLVLKPLPISYLDFLCFLSNPGSSFIKYLHGTRSEG